MKANLHWLLWAVVCVSLIGNFMAFDPRDPEVPPVEFWEVGFFVLGWTILPFTLLAIIGSTFRHQTRAVVILFVTAVLILIGDAYCKWEVMTGPPDAQNGLIFAVMPFWDLFPATLGVAIAFVAMYLARPKSSRPAA